MYFTRVKRNNSRSNNIASPMPSIVLGDLHPTPAPTTLTTSGTKLSLFCKWGSRRFSNLLKVIYQGHGGWSRNLNPGSVAPRPELLMSTLSSLQIQVSSFLTSARTLPSLPLCESPIAVCLTETSKTTQWELWQSLDPRPDHIHSLVQLALSQAMEASRGSQPSAEQDRTDTG